MLTKCLSCKDNIMSLTYASIALAWQPDERADDNDYTRASAIGGSPAATTGDMVVSAHWYTRGTASQRWKAPQTLHDLAVSAGAV